MKVWLYLFLVWNVASRPILLEREPEVPLFGFKELLEPGHSHKDGMKFSQDFLHSHKDGITLLKYDVEKADNVHFVHLSGSDKRVNRIDCSELYSHKDDEGTWFGQIVLEMASPEEATTLTEADKPIILTGSTQWKCLNHKSRVAPLMHRAIGRASRLPGSGNLLLLKVTPAQYHEVFKNAEIHFVTEKFEEDQFMGVYNTDLPVDGHEWKAESAPKRNLLGHDPQVKGWFSSFIKDVWNTAKEVGNYVQQAVNTVATVTKVIATGDYGK